MSKPGGYVRRGDFHENFLPISRFTAEDDRLTFEARGLLFNVLAKPANWQVWIGDLIKRSPAGRNKVYRILNELIEYKYVWRLQNRDHSGRYLPPIYCVYGVPQKDEPEEFVMLKSENTRVAKPLPQKRDAVKRHTEKPRSANHIQTNIHSNKNTNKTTTHELASSVIWPSSIGLAEKESILSIAVGIDVVVFKEIFCELVDSNKPVKNSVGYFYELLKRHREGTFVATKSLLRKKAQLKNDKAEKRYALILEESEKQRVKMLEDQVEKKRITFD
jgi:hypothetical protein